MKRGRGKKMESEITYDKKEKMSLLVKFPISATTLTSKEIHKSG